MKKYHYTMLFFITMLFIPLISSFADIKKSKHSKNSMSKVLVFINSEVFSHNELVRDINHQLFFSETMRKNMNVSIIDINSHGSYVSGPAVYIKDKDGVWVEKYRPVDIPSFYCISDNNTTYKKMVLAQEIRICL